ncbi:MAG TPA: hypothetical protein EYP21_07600, partial [Syntrophaceae bacterium]|nr:hypothetical protein [Syntrophaceae bacterium]
MDMRNSDKHRGETVKIGKDASGKITMAFSYDPARIQKVKTVEGYRWHPKEKHWSFLYSEDILGKILSIFDGENIHVDPALQVSVYPKANIAVPYEKQIIEGVKKEFRLRRYSQKTQKAYLHHINRYMRHFREDPKKLDEGYIKEYLLHLVDQERISRSYHNQAVSALKFLYDHVLNMPRIVGKL